MPVHRAVSSNGRHDFLSPFSCSLGESENLVNHHWKSGALSGTSAIPLGSALCYKPNKWVELLPNIERFVQIPGRKVSKMLTSLRSICGKNKGQGGKASLSKLASHFSAKACQNCSREGKKKEEQVHIYIFKVASNQDNTNYLTTVKKPAAKPHWLFNRVSKCWAQP